MRADQIAAVLDQVAVVIFALAEGGYHALAIGDVAGHVYDIAAIQIYPAEVHLHRKSGTILATVHAFDNRNTYSSQLVLDVGHGIGGHGGIDIEDREFEEFVAAVA